MHEFILSIPDLLPMTNSKFSGVVGAIAFICLLCKPKTKKAYWIYSAIYCVGMIGYLPAGMNFVLGNW